MERSNRIMKSAQKSLTFMDVRNGWMEMSFYEFASAPHEAWHYCVNNRMTRKNNYSMNLEHKMARELQ
ncbi:unnamed protein product [Rhizophagus irregularis]|nr:unnamed protein product [Rhizophagus irregularis]